MNRSEIVEPAVGIRWEKRPGVRNNCDLQFY